MSRGGPFARGDWHRNPETAPVSPEHDSASVAPSQRGVGNK